MYPHLLGQVGEPLHCLLIRSYLKGTTPGEHASDVLLEDLPLPFLNRGISQQLFNRFAIIGQGQNTEYEWCTGQLTQCGVLMQGDAQCPERFSSLCQRCINLLLLRQGLIPLGLPLLARSVLHAGAQGYSLLLWSLGCGTVLGMLLPSLLPFRYSRGLICILLQCIESLLVMMLAIAPLPLAALCIVGWNVLNGVLIVLHLSLIQHHVERAIVGRVTSLWLPASSGLLPLSQLGAGLIINAIGTQVFFVIARSIVLLGSMAGFCVPVLRQ